MDKDVFSQGKIEKTDSTATKEKERPPEDWSKGRLGWPPEVDLAAGRVEERSPSSDFQRDDMFSFFSIFLFKRFFFSILDTKHS